MAWNDLTNPEAWKLALANLLRKGEDVGTYISEAPEKAGKAIVEAGQRQSALMNKAFDPTGKTLIRDPQAANQAAMNLLEGPLGFMPAGITAWHGSPHTFEKFDMSKVGTGEGAQAYGHGMYFAESPNVAKSYIVNTELQKTPEGMARSYAEKYPSTKEAIEGAKNKLERLINNGDIAEAKIQEQVVKSLESGNLGGNLYKVDIRDEHIPMMLDYDAPIKNQPEILQKVRNLIKDPDILKSFDYNVEKGMTGANVYTNWIPTGVNKNALYKQRNDLLNKYMTKDMSMSDAVRAMTPDDRAAFSQVAQKIDDLKNKPKIVSQILNDIGIKGIKYLDQGSRNPGFSSLTPTQLQSRIESLQSDIKSGAGNTQKMKDQLKGLQNELDSYKNMTSNFVVFDPTDVKILERNNQPMTRKEVIEEQVNKLK